MKKLKSVLAFTTALCICAGYLPAPTQTESKMLIATAEDEETKIVDSGECGENLTWTLDSAGTLKISGEGAMTDWTSIDDTPWYDRREEITSVVLENGVTSIGERAFFTCANLTSVTIPDGVTTIGDLAFYECKNLESVTIENPVCTIVKGAIPANENLVIRGYTGSTAQTYATNSIKFESIGESGDCSESLKWKLNNDGTLTISGEGAMTDWKYDEKKPWDNSRDKITSVVLESGVTSIGERAFFTCANLKSVTISESVETIGINAFYGCNNLTSVTIAEGLKTIGSWAFEACSALTSIDIPASVTTIEEDAFNGCKSLTSVTIPESVKTIGERAFANSGLKSIEIPKNVTKIGNSTFSGCSALESITVDADNPNYTDIDGILFDKDKTELIAYPVSRTDTEYTIPDSVKIIGNSAFNGCSALESVTIAEGVKTIGNSAFNGCSALKSIEIPKSVETIGNDTFYGCSALESVTIAEGVKTIGNSAFNGCSALESVTIPESVKEIGMGAFAWSGLTSIEILKSVETIGDYAFFDCSALTSITIENPSCTIGMDAIPANDNLVIRGYTGSTAQTYATNSIKFESIGESGDCGDSLKWKLNNESSTLTISGEGAMTDWENSSEVPWYDSHDKITSVVLESGVTSIGNYAFDDCENLESVTIPASVTTIGDYAFYCCNNLTSVTIPNGVTSIRQFAFTRCTNLTSVNIPASVESIGINAFYWCNNLTSATPAQQHKHMPQKIV